MSVDRKTITSNDSWYTTFVYKYLFIYFYSCGMKFAILSAIGKRKKIGKLPTKRNDAHPVPEIYPLSLPSPRHLAK